jgi:carboxylesterase
MDMHKPSFYRLGGPVLAILVHGICGGPNQFRRIQESLKKENASSLALLLPGHGSTAKEFSASTLEMWEEAVFTQAEKAAADYDSVFLMGHSMGGLLSLEASLALGGKAKEALLLSAPIYVHVSPRALFVCLFTNFAPEEREESPLLSRDVIAGYREAYSIERAPFYAYPPWIRQLAELGKLIRKVRAGISSYEILTTLIHSQRDEAVSLRSAGYFERSLPNVRKRITLKESWHAYFPEEERALIEREALGAASRLAGAKSEGGA